MSPNLWSPENDQQLFWWEFFKSNPVPTQLRYATVRPLWQVPNHVCIISGGEPNKLNHPQFENKGRVGILYIYIYYIVLCYIMLYCTIILYYITLHYIIWYHIIFYYIMVFLCIHGRFSVVLWPWFYHIESIWTPCFLTERTAARRGSQDEPSRSFSRLRWGYH